MQPTDVRIYARGGKATARANGRYVDVDIDLTDNKVATEAAIAAAAIAGENGELAGINAAAAEAARVAAEAATVNASTQADRAQEVADSAPELLTARDVAVAKAGEASDKASIATEAANYAEEFSGPAYDTLAAGQAATATGKFFRVSNGDTPRTYTRYQRTASGSVVAAPLATTAALAGGLGDSLIGVKGDFTGEVLLDQRQLNNGVEIDIRRFGAKFDVGNVANIADATDDTGAWVKAFDALRTLGGGTLKLPAGASKVTAPLYPPIDVPIRITGTGCGKVYPGNFGVGGKYPSTVVPVHSERAAFILKATANGQGGLVADNWNVNAIVSGPVPQAAFAWEILNFFPYGFTFNQVGIYNFRSAVAGGSAAFDVYRPSGTENSVGAVLIVNCTINHNDRIARTSGNTQFNGFRFLCNKAGQNGVVDGKGGIYIAGHDISICDNILEGQREAVRLYGGYRDNVVRGNYFEANSGRACIEVRDVLSYSIGPNYFGPQNTGTLDHFVLLNYTGLGHCADPYWSNGTHKVDLPLLGRSAENMLNNAAAGYVLARYDKFPGKNYSERPAATALVNQKVSPVVRDFNPQTNDVIPVQEYTTTGTGLVNLSYTIAGAAGSWAVVCLPFKRIADSSPLVEPYLSLNLNGTGAAGSADFPAFNFTKYWREGEWVLHTAAIKLGVTMTSLVVGFYPFGINPTTGRVARFLRPTVYLVDDINRATPFLDNVSALQIANAPTTGTWVGGDMLRRSAGGLFVCTLSGSPGTWGTIAPA